ncbi:MAG TPA: DNA primase [Polyangiaceae bacterium]|nr:DNA primase [Polyangiaceae bacterium]
MISKDTISVVRDRTDIVAVVSESVPSLKKRGRRFVGLCPFHKEKTPSFHVNPDTGLYHCFGCKESGDAFTFLERVDGYTFNEAVRALAERAGIAIEEERRSAPSDADRLKKERESLYAVMQMAATWYEEQLEQHPRRSYAEDELARRALSPKDKAVRAFRVGYAPPGWDGLTAFLKKQGASPAVAETVGLVVPRAGGSGYYDRFRHRLMFAVMDAQGRVVAFSGRALAPTPDDDPSRDPPPKYINSPESPIYIKGSTLFGLWQGRHAIRQQEQAVVVEGNFDVVSLHAQGVENVVAPLGTAFTVDQARLLRRYAVKVALLFDGDAAGRKAAKAAEEPCDGAGLDAKVALLPDGADPDEFVRAKGADALRHVITNARGLFEYLIDVELDESFNAADARERASRMDRVAALLARQKDPVIRGMLKAYADYAASRLDLVRSSPDAFRALSRKVAAVARITRTGPRPAEARIRPRLPGHDERKAIVGALLDFPVLLDDCDIGEALGLLQGESARIVAAIRGCLRATQRAEKELDSVEFLAQMPRAIQAFATARLAAPAHETIEDARATVLANVRKLRDSNVGREARETVREQQRVVGNWEAELELVKHADALVRARLIRR